MQEGNRIRKCTLLQMQGVKEFYQYMQTDVEKDVLRSDFLMRMYFGNYSDDKAIKNGLRMKLKGKEAYIADLRLKYEKWRNGITFVEISLDVGIASYSAQVENIEKKTRTTRSKRTR